MEPNKINTSTSKLDINKIIRANTDLFNILVNQQNHQLQNIPINNESQLLPNYSIQQPDFMGSSSNIEPLSCSSIPTEEKKSDDEKKMDVDMSPTYGPTSPNNHECRISVDDNIGSINEGGVESFFASRINFDDLDNDFDKHFSIGYKNFKSGRDGWYTIKPRWENNPIVVPLCGLLVKPIDEHFTLTKTGKSYVRYTANLTLTPKSHPGYGEKNSKVIKFLEKVHSRIVDYVKINPKKVFSPEQLNIMKETKPQVTKMARPLVMKSKSGTYFAQINVNEKKGKLRLSDGVYLKNEKGCVYSEDFMKMENFLKCKEGSALYLFARVEEVWTTAKSFGLNLSTVGQIAISPVYPMGFTGTFVTEEDNKRAIFSQNKKEEEDRFLF